jgi:hypothetical protein
LVVLLQRIYFRGQVSNFAIQKFVNSNDFRLTELNFCSKMK